MPLPRFLGAKLLAAALAFATVPAAIPSSVPVVGVSKAQADPYYRYGGGRGYYGGPRHYRGGYYGGPRHYRGGWGHGGRNYYRHRNNSGAALAAGIVGLGVGAAIASAAQPRYYDTPRYAAPRYAAPRVVRYAAQPWTPEWYQYCSARYRSFDARSGTFQPYNGPRRLCQ